jgi:hypothetical protein
MSFLCYLRIDCFEFTKIAFVTSFKGIRFANGTGVVKHEVTAVKYYTLAANQGHAQAQCNLGRYRGVNHHGHRLYLQYLK